MGKQIVIIGGGVSGLSVLHHLRHKYARQPDVSIRLFEKNPTPGGTIRTIRENGIQFEIGPNGFLDSKSSTLELVKDLDLQDDLINASPATKKRYICSGDVLYPLPSNLRMFLGFQPLTLSEKFCVLKEFVIPPGTDPQETIYEFGVRRFGEGFSKYFLDPMVSGIFGGDVKSLHLKSTFPRIHEIEKTYGSLFKGMIRLGLKQRKEKKKNSLTLGQPTGQLWSFKNGMGQLTETLAEKHSDVIVSNAPVSQINRKNDQFCFEVHGVQHFADQLILSTPAYASAQLIHDCDQELSGLLHEIPYASIVVVGLSYAKDQFFTLPAGFGYLRPSHENKDVLGVLFSSQIYPVRCLPHQIFFQVMLGGAHHPEILDKSDEEIFSIAQNEITHILCGQGRPQQRYLHRWAKAIPQYNRSYPQTLSAIRQRLPKTFGLHLMANYIGGVSLNDCTQNAKSFVARFEC